MYEGTQGQPVTPGGGEVGHLDAVTLHLLLQPVQQDCGVLQAAEFCGGWGRGGEEGEGREGGRERERKGDIRVHD